MLLEWLSKSVAGGTQHSIKKHCDSEDICTPAGILWATVLCMRLIAGGVAMIGVECKSFTWVSWYSSQRHKNILGDDSRPFVQTGNVMAMWVGWVCFWLTAHGAFYMVENPSTSILKKHPSFSILDKSVKQTRVCTWLGAFDTKMANPKPVHLFTTAPVHVVKIHLKKKKPRKSSTNQKAWFKDDRGWVTGTARLTDTGVYPPQFGAAFADMCEQLWLECMRPGM